MQPSQILGGESFTDWNFDPFVEHVTRSLFSKRVSENSPILEHYQIHLLLAAPSKIPGKNAEDILNERYAMGELTREQYVQMKEDIKKPT